MSRTKKLRRRSRKTRKALRVKLRGGGLAEEALQLLEDKGETPAKFVRHFVGRLLSPWGTSIKAPSGKYIYYNAKSTSKGEGLLYAKYQHGEPELIKTVPADEMENA